jgi:hydrogenase nickel incorporation protein HypB
VILSTTEGEDKPLKYPDMFAAAALLLLNKVDLLPHLAFSVEACLANARRINPALEVILTSATTGAGLDAWAAWILEAARAARETREGRAAPPVEGWVDAPCRA